MSCVGRVEIQIVSLTKEQRSKRETTIRIGSTPILSYFDLSSIYTVDHLAQSKLVLTCNNHIIHIFGGYFLWRRFLIDLRRKYIRCLPRFLWPRNLVDNLAGNLLIIGKKHDVICIKSPNTYFLWVTNEVYFIFPHIHVLFSI